MPGLPKSIIKKYGATKKAWAVFRSGRHRRGSSPSKVKHKSRLTMPKHKRRYAMAGRPRRFRRHSSSKRIPLLPTVVGLGTTIVPAVFGGGGYAGALSLAQAGDIGGAFREFADVLSIQTTGYKPSDGSNWGLSRPVATWTAIGLSILGHWALNKFGVNRNIAKIPFIGKYISL